MMINVKKNPLTVMKTFLVMITVCFSSFFSQYTLAAFCSLRDPVETIKVLYPESTSFKSIVKVIDEDIRHQVQKLLPPNTLHFSELGKHTLYVAFKEGQAIGYVHVRSEESDWGLVEIAWAITTDMEVVDFKFQRCRNRQKSTLEKEDFRTQLRGRNYNDFVSMLKADGLSLNTDKINVPAKAKALAEVVIRCGMKTLLVTELAWSKEIDQYRLQKSAKENFKKMDYLEIVDDPVKNSVSQLDSVFGGANTGIERSSVIVAKVFDEKKTLIGLMYSGKLTLDNQASIIEWSMSPSGKILHVNNSMGWKNRSTQKAFENTVGHSYSQANQCNNRAELVTLEAILTAKSTLN